MSYKDMERLSASREQPFSKSEVKELRRNRYLTRMAWEYWQRYFGGDSESERADAVRRLKRWVDLDSVLIPDSGADKMVMAGESLDLLGDSRSRTDGDLTPLWSKKL